MLWATFSPKSCFMCRKIMLCYFPRKFTRKNNFMKIKRKKLRNNCKLRIKYIELTCSHSQTLTENLLRQSTVLGSNDPLTPQRKAFQGDKLICFPPVCFVERGWPQLTELYLSFSLSAGITSLCHHTWLFSQNL